MWKYNNVDELYHYGILGMRWGFRRYQNKDGTLTKAGKRKVNKMKEEYTALTGKKLIKKSSTKKDDITPKKKSISELSDIDLNDKITRYQKEKQLKQLESERTSRGQKIVSTIGRDVIVPSAIEAGKKVLTNWLTKKGSDALGLNPGQTKDALADLKKETEQAELIKRKAVAERDYANMLKKLKENNEAHHSAISIEDSNSPNPDILQSGESFITDLFKK